MLPSKMKHNLATLQKKEQPQNQINTRYQHQASLNSKEVSF